MRMDTDTDPLASPEFKKALKEAMERVEQGLSAAPDELPPVSTKSLGPGGTQPSEQGVADEHTHPDEEDWFDMPKRDL
ncbi:unnamed protein product [Heligmosomoides polygyrus]|uniref:Peroxin-19 n=1 Tax=Heligmosomoides polygyrus TaxID=6339 RepID=A0A183FZU2_HELPZ|nr:unnamed protein product [Heligmosomoides polygyrus]